MLERQQWFKGKPDYENYGLARASESEAYSGHLLKAQDLAERAAASAGKADNKENASVLLSNSALRLAAFGDRAEARKKAAEALKLAPTVEGAEVQAALADDATHAESLVRDLAKRFPLDTQMQSLWLPAIRTQLALDKKNPDPAPNDLQSATTIELGTVPFGTATGLYWIYVRGEANLATGNGGSAAAEFQKILDHNGIVWNCWTGALARLGVARANALQSRTAQGADADAARVRALAAYKDFLTLWKDADSDLPVYRQAEAEYAKLRTISNRSY